MANERHIEDLIVKDTLAVEGTLTVGGAALIDGSVGVTDNRLVRSDGTGGKTVQSTGVTCDDSNNLSGIGTVACGAITSTGSFSNSGYNLTTNTITATNLVVGSNGTTGRTIQINSNTGETNSIFNLKAGTLKSRIYWDANNAAHFTTGNNVLALSLDENQKAVLAGQIEATGISSSGATGTTASIGDREYTPTEAASTNTDSVSFNVWRWFRVGNRVTCFGSLTIDPTAASTVTVNMTIPVASAFTSATDLSGHGNSVSGTPTTQPTIIGDAINDNAQLIFTPAATTSQTFYCCFCYTVK